MTWRIGTTMGAPLRNRTFGLALAAIFGTASGVARFFFDSTLIWPLIVAACFGIIALVVPWMLLPLNRLWHALAYPLGQLLNYIILGVFFFAIIVPVGFAMRLLRRDQLRRQPSAAARSLWSDVQRHTDAETLRDMF